MNKNDNARRGVILHFSINYYNAYLSNITFNGDLSIGTHARVVKKFAGSLRATDDVVGTLILYTPRFRKDRYLSDLISQETIVKFLPYHYVRRVTYVRGRTL